MAADKRTILSSKRARNLRKKAQRASAKALAAEAKKELEARDPELDSGNLTATDTSSGDDEPSDRTRVAMGAVHPCAQASEVILPTVDNNVDDERDCSEADEDEMVFVCRPLVQDFCTEFVPSADSTTVAGRADSDGKLLCTASHSQFTVRIPAFRETRGGYTTYSIQVTTLGDARRQFQLERRYSEFVAFATALDEYFKSEEYAALKEKHQEDSRKVNEHTGGMAFHWELPPKTWFRMTHTTALEDRRSKLEWSLQSLLAHDPQVMCAIPLMRDFLMLDIFGAQVVEEEKLQCV